jgi:Fic family protein
MAQTDRIRTNELILDAVSRHPEGATIRQIAAALQPTMAHRTLQRRLMDLVSGGRLRTTGRGRGTLYLAAFRATAVQRAHSPMAEYGTPSLDLSPEARMLHDRMLEPLHTRTPVGYDHSFLDSYRPDTTFYLPEHVRADLAACGQSVGADAPAGTHARLVAGRLLIDLSWNSSRLEGNTYSLLETERLLSGGEMTEGKKAFDAQMILNHKGAIEFLISSAAEIGFNCYTILNLHALLADNLLPNPMACGRLRTIPVAIAHSVFHPLENPHLIEERFDLALEVASAITDPFEQAFFTMVHLPSLQPFEDVNKRVSRLAANIPLIRSNLCPLSFVDVPRQAYLLAMIAVYELRRIELLRDIFIWAYRRSCARYGAIRQSLGEPDPFRLTYRALITEIVAEVVQTAMNKARASAFVQTRARELLDQKDRERFVETVETELMGLTENNIARHRLRPSEFMRWKSGWE